MFLEQEISILTCFVVGLLSFYIRVCCVSMHWWARWFLYVFLYMKTRFCTWFYTCFLISQTSEYIWTLSVLFHSQACWWLSKALERACVCFMCVWHVPSCSFASACLHFGIRALGCFRGRRLCRFTNTLSFWIFCGIIRFKGARMS